ncbi:MAG: MerR family transcriptional regulator [Ignavibacteria bacterium]|nr:MerR family transcriptional regulator [Ignavibacteria bacterium]
MHDSATKLYFSITEVSKMLGEEQHVLRYWEREFTQLHPRKNRAGNRIYTERDIAVLIVIRKLLREERYTVAGAKDYIKANGIPEHIADDLKLTLKPLSTTEVAAQENPHTTPDPERMKLAKELVQELRDLAAALRVQKP